MKKVITLFLFIMLLFNLASCGQTSNNSTVPNRITISLMPCSYIKTINNPQEIEKLWNSYKNLKLEKTDADLEIGSTYTINFLFRDIKKSETVLLDKNGTIQVNDGTQSYVQTENILNYADIMTLYSNG